MVSCKSFGLTFKLYNTTKTLVIQGKDEQPAKAKLFDIIRKVDSLSSEHEAVLNKYGGEEQDHEEDDSIASSMICLDSVIEQHETLSESSPSTTIISLVKEIAVLKKGYQEISSKVNSLSLSAANAEKEMVSKRVVNQLQDQLAVISDENKMLLKRNQDLENENSSLLTAIRLLQGPENTNKQKSNPTNKSCSSSRAEKDIGYQVINKKKKKEKKDKSNKNIKDSKRVSSSIKSNNLDQNDIQENYAQNENNQPSTIIVGDSIVKRLNSHSMSKSTKSKVIVRSFPGARIKDMYHYMKPALQDVGKPANVILHVGTNDLKDKSPQSVADEIQDLARFIEINYQDVTVNISTMTQRYDVSELTAKVGKVNKITKRYCGQSERYIIPHDNIDDSSLNAHKLHLNNKGVALIASNFTNFIVNHR